MSTTSAADSATVEDIVKPENFELWTRVPTIRHYKGHTKSRSTRLPSLYDTHLPKGLQPTVISLGKPHYQPDSSDISDPFPAVGHYFEQLSNRQGLLTLLTKEVQDRIRFKWETRIESVNHIAPKDENGVSDAEKEVARIVFDLAALALLDLSEDQLKHIGAWAVLATYISTETGTRVDLLGMQDKDKITDDDANNSALYDAIAPLVEDLDQEYMKYISAIECKNLLLGKPMGYLTLLLLSRLTQNKKLRSLWPEADCSDCGEYRKSHQVRIDPTLAKFPSDSEAEDQFYGLEALSPDSQTGSATINKEILRIIDLISLHPDLDDTDEDETTRNPPNIGKFYAQVRDPMEELLQSLGHEEMLARVMRWVTRIRNIFVQMYMQLVTHNLTFGTVSSHNNSFLVQRLRKSGTAIISPLQEATRNGYIIQRAVWFIDAWCDAVDRSMLDPEVWEEPDGDNDGQQRQSKRLKAKTNSQSCDGGNPPHHPPPSGAEGAGGAHGSGAGSRSGGSIRGGTDSSNNKRSAADDSSNGSGSNKKHRLNAEIKIVLDGIHLGFDCDQCQPPLKSFALSKYRRVPFENLATGHIGTTQFPIPFSTATPSRRTIAASLAPSRIIGDSSERRSSVATVSCTNSSSVYVAPLSSTPSIPSGDSRGQGANVAPSTLTRPSSSVKETPVARPTAFPARVVSKHPPQSLPIIVHRAGTILDTKIAKSAIGVVWGGRLILEGLSFPVDHLRIVVKLADWERDSEREGDISDDGKAILKEAEAYEHLAKVAPDSKITPHYYGVFNCLGSIALVLDDDGERLPRGAFEKLEVNQKRKLFEMAEQLHKLEIKHCDLSPRNILQDKEGNLRIIDFHASQLGHKCSGSTTCDELRQFAKDMGLEV